MDTENKEQFDKVNTRFDSLQAFMVEHLVTKADLDERIASLPTKEDFQNVITHIDGYSKTVKDVADEVMILGEKANQLEVWAKQAGTKLGADYTP